MKNKIKELTNKDFNEFIKEGIVLIDFWAEWCMPCLAINPILDELSNKFKDKIKFGKVNVGTYAEIAQKFNVNSIPNIIIFKDGIVINQLVGSISSDELENKLESYLE